ncbi:MAG: S9 family peptidase [Planctomycetota bacterium]
MLRPRIFSIVIGICSILPFAARFSALAAEEPSDHSLLTVAQIFEKNEFDPEPWRPPCWLKTSAGYTALEASAKLKDAKDLVYYDPQSGSRKVLVCAASLVPTGRSVPLEIEDYTWSEDAKKVLLFTNAKRVWRQPTRGDYWLLDRDTNRLQKLGGDAKESTMRFATFSPDGHRVAYVCENNLYVQDLRDLQITQLTSDGCSSVINGTSDWVNEEEFDLRHGFRWSPDGQNIAYWQFDTSRVRTFHLIDNTVGLYPEIVSYKYPKVGEANSACRIGVVSCRGGATRWLNAKGDPSNHYIPQMEWSPDSRHVVFQQLNRLQNTSRIIRGNVANGHARVIFTDRDDAWIDVVDKWKWTWIEQGRRFLWLSERDGWRHLYSVSRSGKTIRLLTPGPLDVIGVAGVDEEQGCVYFIASPENPTQHYLYRVPLDGSGRLTRVTPEDQPGTHEYHLSPDCRWAFHTYSRMAQPPRVELVSLPEHKLIRTVTDNAKLRCKLSRLKTCPSEFFRVDIGGGVLLDAWCIKPPNFDPAKRYPLLIYVYGEPCQQTVTDRWGGHDYLWHCFLAQQGYLVMNIDNRGTDAPRGRAWRKCIYRQVGILASADQAAALRKILQERPYVDPKRVGIWGWSGGGSMSLNAIFRYPELYRMAMAVAFISDQRLYDTIYQERYMGLPDDNQEGYKNGSPITFAHQLQGNLLLVHGTADDNCHYQSCEMLINELIRHDKPFSMMAYPNRTHSIQEGPNTQLHLFQTLTRYLKENLPPE